MKHFSSKTLAGLLLLLIVAPLIGLWWFADSPQLLTRRKLVRLKTMGALPAETWSSVIYRMRPSFLGGSSRDSKLLKELTVAAVLDSPGDLEAGERLFGSHCVQCHATGDGSMGPDLTRAAYRTRLHDSDIYWTIAEGIAGTSMPRFQGDETQILQLTAFVGSLVDKDAEREGAMATGQNVCPACESIDVSYEQLRQAGDGSNGWLTYSGSYSGQRFSPLQQINRKTIARLRPRWVHQMQSSEGVVSHPLVIGGVMFLTGPANEVMALDAGTGEVLWTFARPIVDNLALCCGRVNRGVAVLGKRVYHATLDGHLIALDVANGRPVWDVQVADPGAGYSLTGAPLAVKDKIIVGVAGGDLGVRGFLDAYDAETGKRMWRFETIPGPGEAGHETWENDAWKTGGGGTWVTGSFDPDLNLLYWGVGNASPIHDGDYRPGDNLYTCSVLALDPDTGELKWHYQFTPHDTSDWDATIVPVLADLEYGGRMRKLMLWANRNCFYYILDRETGRFLQAKEYCEQNWNDGFTDEGRPVLRPSAQLTTTGALVRPSPFGGSNWWSPSYSPRTGLYYVTRKHMNTIVWRAHEEFIPGRFFTGGGSRMAPGGPGSIGVVAINAVTGDVAWQKQVGDNAVRVAGVLATAGDLVFTANGSGVVFALDASTGEEVWQMRLGGPVGMGPITYLYEGRQQLAVISSSSLFVMDLAGQ